VGSAATTISSQNASGKLWQPIHC